MRQKYNLWEISPSIYRPLPSPFEKSQTNVDKSHDIVILDFLQLTWRIDMIELAGKSYLKGLTRTADCPLRFSVWRFYSYLVACRGKGSGHGETAWSTGLSPGKTVIQCRDNLRDYGLVRREGNRLFAEPPRDCPTWFKVSPGAVWDAPDWHGNLWTWRCYRPAERADGRSLDHYDSAVASLLYSLSTQKNGGRLSRLSYSLLYSLTGISRPTIKASVQRLLSLGLVTGIKGATPAFFGLGVFNPNPYRLGFFADVHAAAPGFDPDADFIPDFAEVKSEKVVFPEAKESVTILKGEQAVNREGPTDVYLERRRDQGPCAAGGGREDCDAGGARAAIERRLHSFGVELGLRGLFLERITTHAKANGLEWYLKHLNESHDREQFGLRIHQYHRDRGMDDDKLVARIMGCLA